MLKPVGLQQLGVSFQPLAVGSTQLRFTGLVLVERFGWHFLQSVDKRDARFQRLLFQVFEYQPT